MLAIGVEATVGVKVGRRVLVGGTLAAESCDVVETDVTGVAESTTVEACVSELAVGVRIGKVFLIRMDFEASVPSEQANETSISRISIQTIDFDWGSLSQRNMECFSISILLV